MRDGMAEHFKAHAVIKASDSLVSYDEVQSLRLSVYIYQSSKHGCVLPQDHVDLLFVSLGCRRHVLSSASGPRLGC